MIREADNYYYEKEEPNRSCLLALRAIILEQDSDVTETWKWEMPCFCFRGKMFCFLRIDKKTEEPYVLMVEGKQLDHPELEAGTRSRMKILRIDPNRDLPIVTIQSVLDQALNLYRTGAIRVK